MKYLDVGCSQQKRGTLIEFDKSDKFRKKISEDIVKKMRDKSEEG